VYHELVLVAHDGGDLLAAVDGTFARVGDAYRRRWSVVMATTWTPE